VLTAALLAAALAAGITGAWSPCGLSMVETLGPQGYAGRLRTTLVACVTFSLGAVAGGVATFGGLALLGAALGAGSAGAAALVALAAAAGEARGLRIVPQVRRQVPEGWRRTLPVPLAAGLYGVLLGLGFTTFILSFAVWALAGIAVALGDPALGLAIGVAFGVGRALPVVALAPGGSGAPMAERPEVLRALRRIDAVALVACAVALGAAPAQAAAAIAARGASDPSADGTLLAWHRPGGQPGLLAGAPLPGTRPALGGGLVAWLEPGAVVVRDVVRLRAGATDALAVSAGWVAWREQVLLGRDALVAAPLGTGEGPRQVALAGAEEELGRPALAGGVLAFHVAGARGSRIESIDLATGARTVLREERGAQLTNPALHGDALLYVRATSARQQLRIGPRLPRPAARDRALYGTVATARRDRGHEPGERHHRHGHPRPGPAQPRRGVADTLWTTALGDRHAWVTRLRQRRGLPVESTILRVTRRGSG